MKRKGKRQRSFKEYARWSALAFQMSAIILLSLFAGVKADKYFQTEAPYFTASLTLLGAAAAIYYLFREVLKK